MPLATGCERDRAHSVDSDAKHQRPDSTGAVVIHCDNGSWFLLRQRLRTCFCAPLKKDTELAGLSRDKVQPLPNDREAREQGFIFKGRKKSTGGNEESRFKGRFIDSASEWRDLLDDELQLLAGTAWLFAREDFEGHLHTLFVDEAGQVALADALAVGSAARNIVLLGDPNQLPQVSQGAQPEEAKVSVLQHLLGADETVPPERGIFLERTWRLRPEICDFTSEAYYEGRLLPAEMSGRRSLAAGIRHRPPASRRTEP